MNTVHPAVPPAVGWTPVSPCGTRCLGPGPSGLTAGAARLGRRLAVLATVLLLAAAATPALPLVSARTRARWLRAGSAAALRAAGVRVRVTGERPYAGHGVLVVANHQSWIDVLALCAVQPVRMLAKREVRDWPLIGGLADRSGAVFVDRSGLRTLPATVDALAAAMRAGHAVGAFPEGTTWCGAAAGPFRRAAFQAALDAGVPVRPVAIVLRGLDGDPVRAGAFVGEQTLWDSLCRVLRLPALVCELTVLPAILPGAAADRRELAALAQASIAVATGLSEGMPARAPVGAARPPHAVPAGRRQPAGAGAPPNHREPRERVDALTRRG